MLATKNGRNADGRLKLENLISRRPFPRLHLRLWLFLAFALFLSGCTPPGPRALLAGKRLLDRGDYAAAAAQLKTATTLMATNAVAWDYYGVALQYAGRPADAARAYQNALRFNRDLTEAHYNLGCLWLEEGRFSDAKAEFTAYTLRRNNTPEGWLKLGAVQLKMHDLLAAEKSFSTAFYLNTNNAEALNGLGLASVEQGRPENAARFFAAAVNAHPDFAPALLNLATVEDRYLHHDALALKYYRAYLALTPRPADWNTVNNLVKSLEPSTPLAAARPAPVVEQQPPPPARPSPVETRPRPVVRRVAPPREREVSRSEPAPLRPTRPTQVATARREPANVPAARVSTPEHRAPAEAPAETAPARKTSTSVWQRINPVHWFGSSSYTQSGVTPLQSGPPPAVHPPPAAVETPPAPVKMVSPAPPTFPRYLYLSPRKPKAGDRKAAVRPFMEAQQFERQEDWPRAKDDYHRAAELDPSWFAAQYNWAVTAYQARDYNQALTASEMALAIEPASVDARYNFALALKAAGYAEDALNELDKIVAAHPDEARVQLALGNLYAEQMHNTDQARRHYLKWLQLEPHAPEANNIRFWLSANPP